MANSGSARSVSKKSLKGLDNTAADGAEGFEALYEIVDQLEEVGADKEWSSQTRKRLKDSKLYLKTTYRDHCQEESACPDHCRVFALSDANDADKHSVTMSMTMLVAIVIHKGSNSRNPMFHF